MGVYAFPKGISLKVNVIVQLEFELTMMLQSSIYLQCQGDSLTSIQFIKQWEKPCLLGVYIYQTHNYKQIVKQGQFWGGVMLVCNQSFPSSKLVAIPRFNHPYYLFTHSLDWESRWIHAFPNYQKMKRKLPCPGFGLKSPIPFPIMITVMLYILIWKMVTRNINPIFLIDNYLYFSE